MACDNIIILEGNSEYTQIIKENAKDIQIWDVDKNENKTIVQFSSSVLPNLENVNVSLNYIWSYYYEKKGFVCLGYVKIKDGQKQKSISWNNANVGFLTEKDTAYAKKFFLQFYPEKAKVMLT